MAGDIAAASPPSVSWAQRSSKIFLTFNVECDKPEIEIARDYVLFKGVCGPDNTLHEVKIPLYAFIDPDKSTQTNKGRCIEVCLFKEKTSDPFWPSLTNDKKKHHWLKVDFDKWQDEDESNDEFDDDMFSDKLGDLGFGNDDAINDSSNEEDSSDFE